MQSLDKTACRRLLAGILALLGPLPAAAGLLRLDVTHSEAGFRIAADAHLDAPPPAVAAVLLDLSRYPNLDPGIMEARVMAHPGPDRWRVRTITRGCVAGFCRTVRQEQEIVRQSCRSITATLV